MTPKAPSFAAHSAWRQPLLERSLWLLLGVGSLWLTLLLATQTAYRSIEGVLVAVLLGYTLVMALGRKLPEALRLSGLLVTPYGASAISMSMSGPLAPGGLLLLALFLLFAALYLGRRGMWLGLLAIAALYIAIACGWIYSLLPLNAAPAALLDLTRPLVWLRIALGHTLLCLCITAMVKSVLEHTQRATLALERSEERFARAFHASPEAISISDVETGRFIDVNEGFERLLDWPRAALVGKTSFEIGMWVEPAERKRLAEIIGKSGVGRDLPTTLKQRDGTPLPCLVSVQTIELEGRACFVVAVRDIRERLLAEQALRESEEKFSKAFDASAEAMSITVAATGRFVDVNKGYEVLMGHSRDSVLGRTAVEIGLWTDPSTRVPMMQKLASERVLRDYPVVLQDKSGKLLDVLFSAEFVELGGVPHVVSAVRDVSEQRKAERALKQSEERFRLLIEHAPDAIVVFDMGTGRFVEANPAALQLFGLSRERLFLLGPVEVSPERQANGLLTVDVAPGFLAAAMAGERPRFEWLHKHVDGREIPCEVRLLRLPDPERLLIRGSILDVSEQRKAERQAEFARAQSEAEIRKLNTELEQRVADRTAQLTEANAELESFSYSVSHDLRSPLRAIDGFSKALEEDYGDKLDADANDYLRRVRAACQRMGQLIDDLLQLSRASRVELRRERLDLHELASEVDRELRERHSERDVKFQCEPGLVAQADRALSRVVIENLLDNAWKYSKGRSEARIEFGRLPTPDEQGQSVFFVRDNGAGFDMRYSSKLFSPFQRLHTKAEFEGTGIGLASVRRIVGRHGGKAWAESVLDEGTIVYFTLSGAST